MDSKSICCTIFLAYLFSGSNAMMTDAEVKAEFIKVTMSCMKDHPVEMTDLLKLKNMELPENREAKCLLACTYKKVGTMTEDGVFDINKLYKVAEKTKDGDEKAIANGKKLSDVCVKVNDEKVTDGSKGCERAGLMFTCIIGNAPKFGFTV